jgi:predicted dehydrogenase
MEMIRWGIIGCGDVTEVKSGPAFNKVENSSLVAVMRRDAAKAEDYARRHGVARWYDHAQSLIDDPEVNAVYVATPPSTHELYTIAALEAGKPVYVEKPMANSYAAAINMVNAAKANGGKLVVAHYRREQPRFRKVKELIREKAIGEPLLVRLELTKPPVSSRDLEDPMIAWRVNPAIAGGGFFHDLAPHQLDLVYHFFGPIARSCGVSTNQAGAYNADDMVTGTSLFKNGVSFIGSWCFNADAMVARDLVEIIGTKGKISFSVFSEHTITVTTNGQAEILEFEALAHVQQPMIDATVNYFLGRGENPASDTDGAEIMRLIEEFTGH